MNNKDLEAIGLRIRERRMALGLTQTALAQKLDVTAQAVSKWETGTGYPDLYVLPELSRALEISVDALLGMAPMPGAAQAAAEAEPETVPPEEAQPEAPAAEAETQGPVTERDILDAPEAPDLFSDGEQAFRDAEDWLSAFEEKKEPEEEWIPHLTTDPAGDEERARAQEAAEHAADPVYTVHKDEYTPRPHHAQPGQKAEEPKAEEKGEPRQEAPGGQGAGSGYTNYTNYRAEGAQYRGDQSGANRAGYAPYSNVPPYGEAPQQPPFNGSAFAHEISNMVNSAVRAAMGAAKTAKNEVQRAAAGSGTVQRGYGTGGAIRSVNLDVAGSGDVIVHAGMDGPWHAEIRAPEAMFTRIVCQEEDGVLYVRIPPASQFGFFGFNPQVRVEIFAGFALGEQLTLNVRGSADTRIEPDFARSEVHIAGSGDVEMRNAGRLNYSVAGSGDFTFGNAEDASIRISGSSDVSGGILLGRTSIHISGSGDFDADRVVGTLEAVSTGSGDFDISEGDLQDLKIRCSGSGNFYAPNLETVDAEIRISGGGDVVLGSVKGNLVQHLSRISSLKIRR